MPVAAVISTTPDPASGSMPAATGYRRPLVLLSAGDPMRRHASLALAARLCHADGVVVVVERVRSAGGLAGPVRREHADLAVVGDLDEVTGVVRVPVAVAGTLTEASPSPSGPIVAMADELDDLAAVWMLARQLLRPVQLVTVATGDRPPVAQADAAAPAGITVARRTLHATDRAAVKAELAAAAALLVCRSPAGITGRSSVLLLP